MTDEEKAEEYTKGLCKTCTLDTCRNNTMHTCAIKEYIKQAFLAGLKAGKDMNVATRWHEYSERPKKKINALCFDISQNKFILGFYDLEADEWLRYGGYETINIDLWTKIEIPEFIKE